MKNLFADKLKIDEPASVVYSLGKTVRNKILIYKETVSSINTNGDIAYGTGIVECQQNKGFVDENHDHVLTGDLRIITNSKLRKLKSKGPNFREAITITWNKCKREIEIGFDLLNGKERFSKKLAIKSFL